MGIRWLILWSILPKRWEVNWWFLRGKWLSRKWSVFSQKQPIRSLLLFAKISFLVWKNVRLWWKTLRPPWLSFFMTKGTINVTKFSRKVRRIDVQYHFLQKTLHCPQTGEKIEWRIGNQKFVGFRSCAWRVRGNSVEICESMFDINPLVSWSKLDSSW